MHHVGEVRVTQAIDEGFDLHRFALGDLQVGPIRVHIPAGRATFQGDFDFTQEKGFVLRVSAGVDLEHRLVDWLLQAIDPETGEVIQSTDSGLLGPNNAQGDGVGFVSYTIQLDRDVTVAQEATAEAQILFNTDAPRRTHLLSYLVDPEPPSTSLTVESVSDQTRDFLVQLGCAGPSGWVRRSACYRLRRDR